MSSYRCPGTIYGLLMLLSTLVSRVTPTLADLSPSATTNSSNRIVPHCFTPDTSAGIGETNLKDCRDALVVLASNPDFTVPMSFSKNHRRGHKIPRGWASGDCVIFVSCANDRDAYTFRFADVLVVAKRLVDTCVGRNAGKWGFLKWGGVDILGNSETFYVSVGRPHPRRSLDGSATPVELVNGTLLDLAIGVS
ncbi:hypothetical protein HO133_003873 [Letharia lupina]|uniref:Ecp2 effector protein domain-containing protein n=1 Tax=Letharia lupina TaxID=560253 RepID=A0A8H6CAN6_9LECA|nr:uncharacterized protein HO133_003873 [Letharia lupina]KAF6220048.1 hypothetical protein HO133_003873 [Letharia lupina]